MKTIHETIEYALNAGPPTGDAILVKTLEVKPYGNPDNSNPLVFRSYNQTPGD